MGFIPQFNWILYIKEMKLSIIYQHGGRPYLESITRNFLIESLGEFKDYEWIELDCHKNNLTIGAGFNRLVEQVKTEYVMNVLDDFAFFPYKHGDKSGEWVNMAITILENRDDIGIINLRKEYDHKYNWTIKSHEEVKGIPFYIYEAFANRGWSFNPLIMKTKVLKKIIPLDEEDKTGNVAEATGWENWQKLGLEVAKLDIPYKGVAFNLGWNRSCYFGYKDRQEKIIRKYYGK